MRFDGTLTKWNDDRGFGFITPTLGGQEMFAHISAFPRDGGRPTIGEAVSFEVEVDVQGKKRAVNIRYPGRPSARPMRQQPIMSGSSRERPALFGRVRILVVVVSLVFWGYGEFSQRMAPQSIASNEIGPTTATTNPAPAAQSFRCDGRTHCSQMASCTEAKFFLRNCPGVEMDGNHDGVPCEQQWCNGFMD
ncbi:MAG: cold shock domain-containing protein [Hydrogenophilales bacterium]|nr:cold shock domain-containing protein [Hydrogenophilales bacterium]